MSPNRRDYPTIWHRTFYFFGCENLKYFIVPGLKTTTEFSEKFGKDKLHFIKCNVLQKDDIVNLYEVKM